MFISINFIYKKIEKKIFKYFNELNKKHACI